MSVDVLAILDELSGAPYNIYPRSIEIIILMTISFGNGNKKISLGSQNYMGASFQAPHAAPRQRQMEMHHDSLIILYFSMLLPQITQVCTNEIMK